MGLVTISYPVPEDGSPVSIAGKSDVPNVALLILISTGSFNRWQPQSMILSKDEGSYKIEIENEATSENIVFYKFVLQNGDWVLLDGQPTTPDASGVLNHFIQHRSSPLDSALEAGLNPAKIINGQDHMANPGLTKMPIDIGTEVIEENIPNNEYPAEQDNTAISSRESTTVESSRVKSTIPHDNHLDPTAQVFNPTAAPFIPSTMALGSLSDTRPMSRSSRRQRSHSRSRSRASHTHSHARSRSVAHRPMSGNSISHDELNPTAIEFKPQFARPTHIVPHASGYAAALKKPASPPLKEESKKSRNPSSRQTSSAPSSRVDESATPAMNHARNGSVSAGSASYAEKAKQSASRPNTSASNQTAPTPISKSKSKQNQGADRENGRLKKGAMAPPNLDGAVMTDNSARQTQQDTKLNETEIANDPQPDDKGFSQRSASHGDAKYKQNSAVSTVEAKPVAEAERSASEASPDAEQSAVANGVDQFTPERVSTDEDTVTTGQKNHVATVPEIASTDDAIRMDQNSQSSEEQSKELPSPKDEAAVQTPSIQRIDTIDLSSAEYDAEQIRFMEEVCILLDRDDNAIGSVSKKDAHLMTNINEGLLHRAFSLFIFNSEKQLLLQQRASEKITFPNMWTNTCCSHPLSVAGEVADDLGGSIAGVKRAAQRKVDQELGIKVADAPIDQMHFLTRIHYLAPSDGQWGEHEIDYILVLRSDPKLAINPNEVRDHKWVSQEDLRNMFNSQDLSYTPWFKLICETFLFKWWANLGTISDCKDESTIHRLGIEPELYNKITPAESSPEVSPEYSQHPVSEDKSPPVTDSDKPSSPLADAESHIIPHHEEQHHGDQPQSSAEALVLDEDDIKNSKEEPNLASHQTMVEAETTADPETIDPAAEDVLPIESLHEPVQLTSSVTAAQAESEQASHAKSIEDEQNTKLTDPEASEPAAEDVLSVTSLREQEPFTNAQDETSSLEDSPDVHRAKGALPGDTDRKIQIDTKDISQSEVDAEPVSQTQTGPTPRQDSADCSRPSTGKSIKPRPNFFIYLFNSLIGGFFASLKRINFSKLAFWRKSASHHEHSD